MHSKSIHELKQEVRRGLYQKATSAHRQLIQSAAEEGIEWRGEDYKHFLRVIAEVDIASQLRLDDYRFEAVRWMKSLKVTGELPYDKSKRLAG